ncbi:hypothetical protein [Halalkalicoccus ordinarius]|uniref:hypothetical protein n=1 Tax=Halalkalicoccus ordinarius TaxID=3116651 RepID=UPI00300F27F5
MRPNDPFSEGTIFEAIVAAPYLSYMYLDMSLTPLGWSAEILLGLVVTVGIGTGLATWLGIDSWMDLSRRTASRRALFCGGLVLGLLGLLPVVGWIVLWLSEGISPIEIITGIATAPLLPIDFVIGVMMAFFGIVALAKFWHAEPMGNTGDSQPDCTTGIEGRYTERGDGE